MPRKSRVGRPPKAEADQLALVPVRFLPDILERLDEQIEARGTGINRSALIREYVVAGLLADERKGRK